MTQPLAGYAHIQNRAGQKHLTDKHHRTVSYLRLSVTDRCNMRCRYCMPEEGLKLLNHTEILSYEEFLRLTRLCLNFSVSKVRITGGEPLVRKGIVGFIKSLKELPVPDLRLTTNGTLLGQMAGELFEAGIKRVNVSLDTLNRDKFKNITRRDELERVLWGLDKALEVGFAPVKVNVVAIRGTNDDEIENFVRLAMEKPLSIRFIEYMPMEQDQWREELFISADEILDRVSQTADLTPLEYEQGDGPARRFKVMGGLGEIGVISPLSQHFCGACNRLRLTADGKLLSCLFADKEIDIRTPLRNNASDDELLELIRQAVAAKPDGHNLQQARKRKNGRHMSAIGG